jgi:Winged helix DNA-binding domain
VASDVLSARALGRATLARQHLLARTDAPVLDVVAHLVGLQAQVPLDPYTALWSRIDGFRPEALADRLVARDVVRIVVMRGTIHLVTAEDCLLLRPLMQPVLDAELRRHRDAAPALEGVDLAPVLAYAAATLAEQPLSGTELRAVLAERFPGRDPAALALACRCRLALVQVPPRGVWGATSQVRLATAESWLGRPLARRPSLDDVVLRYVAAFGPARVRT